MSSVIFNHFAKGAEMSNCLYLHFWTVNFVCNIIVWFLIELYNLFILRPAELYGF